MLVQILSDLHLEAPKAYDYFTITPKAPYLALLGDIGNVVTHRDDFLAFLTTQLKQFRAVLFVPGNHEAYGSSWPATLAVLQAFEERVAKDDALGQFVLLHQGAFRLPDTNTVILGCSFFSHVPPESKDAVSFGVNDFYQIDEWDVEAHHEAHRRDLAWLNEQVEQQNNSLSIAILTHWSPSRHDAAIDPKHRKGGGKGISSGFSTDVSQEKCFRSAQVKLWAFGHTHYNCDFEVEREGVAPLRLVANQRGYYFSQAGGFDGEKTVELE